MAATKKMVRDVVRTESAPPASIDVNPNDAVSYFTDAAQRNALFLDTMLDRGNGYLEHLKDGTPPLLKFEHELVLDGHDLPEPCNYALLRLLPPADMPVDFEARPVIVVDPRAGHGPGIGGFKFDSEVGMAMRYAGATLGGSWLASMTADMGAGRFDGAHLVDNFERLNPANTLWNKHYNLWAGVDTESERFLEFERWWGGFFRMTGSEI